VADPVPKELFNTNELTTLVRDMSEALDREPDGVALAAPQVGVSYRLFIVRTDRTLPAPTGDPQEKREPLIDVYVNPSITKTSRKRARAEEGCLSVRGKYGFTRPHERVTIRAQRTDGTTFERGAGGLLAQIFEHEMNHLNGILFTDHAEDLMQVPPSTNE
jgi:peptide deformylase